MWFGMAAAVTGLIVFRYDLAWQWQLIWFCGLSLAAVLLAAKYLRQHPPGANGRCSMSAQCS